MCGIAVGIAPLSCCVVVCWTAPPGNTASSAAGSRAQGPPEPLRLKSWLKCVQPRAQCVQPRARSVFSPERASGTAAAPRSRADPERGLRRRRRCCYLGCSRRAAASSKSSSTPSPTPGIATTAWPTPPSPSSSLPQGLSVDFQSLQSPLPTLRLCGPSTSSVGHRDHDVARGPLLA